MAPFASSLVTFLLAAPLLASAVPHDIIPKDIILPENVVVRNPYGATALPRDATHLALDEQAREIVAFRRDELLGRFPVASGISSSRRDAATGSCSDMSSDDVQKLPGWNTLKSTAENNWGKGSYNVVTNDKDYPDSPAQICVSTDIVNIVPDGNPSASSSCNTQSSASDGQQVGTNGTIALTHQEGTESTTTSTVTKETSISTGVSVSAEVGFPDIADVTTAFTFTGTFTNSLSTATSSTNDQTSTATVTQSNSAGKMCHLEFTTQTCTITGTGKIRMLGTGWVWFEYNDQTQGHYKWALSIDSTLTNQDDRSTFIEFKSTTGTTSTSNYQGVCQ
ncbi:hypothetical protein GGX14DRAFT_429403 [Mycena pura]|uniref:Uncharacterized protein n=1 Tax=Mycena pura TaxID=153505 RepID=A0AAD6VS76_9AGAR|nr:hypothetical protein GGX14DRAFT_429403 [Mycena pura]